MVPYPAVIPFPSILGEGDSALFPTRCTKVFMCVISFTQAYFTELSWESRMHTQPCGLLAYDQHIINTDKRSSSSLDP